MNLLQVTLINRETLEERKEVATKVYLGDPRLIIIVKPNGVSRGIGVKLAQLISVEIYEEDTDNTNNNN